MKNKLKIIRFLLDNTERRFSIRTIAQLLNLNYRIAFHDIKRLEEEKLVVIQKLGNTNLCHFSHRFNEKVWQIEMMKKEELLKNKDIRVFYERINEIRNPFFIGIIFGSYARRKQTKQSDIDFCLITDDQNIKNQMEKLIRTLPLEIHLLTFSIAEFVSMLKTTNRTVAKEIIENKIILKGIESFYELINHAR